MGDRNMSVNSNIWQNKIHFIDVNLLVCSLMHGHRTYIYIYSSLFASRLSIRRYTARSTVSVVQ